jgi:D-alanyl-D-alanine carboxypeptidase (penicillin-binding protein 5/6)
MVTAVAAEQLQCLVDKAQRGDVSTQIQLEKEVTAPISQGQKLGTLTIKVGDQVLAQVNLVAEKAVARRSWRQIFLDLLRKITMAA